MKSEGNSGVVNIGVAGHVDHGKSTLTCVMTALLAKRGFAVAETMEGLSSSDTVREWGMAFRRSVVEYRTDRRRYRHIDCPGQMDFVKSVIGGSLPLDAALLVVSAADGPMAHTRTQLSLIRLLDVPVAAVFINKVDSIPDTELVGRVEEEVRDMLSECGYSGDAVPFLKGSALLALQNLDSAEAVGPFMQLFDVLDEMIPVKEEEAARPFLLPTDSVYHDGERGMVVTGTVERGSLSTGDTVVQVGMNGITELVVTGIDKSSRGKERAVPGDLVELSFAGEAHEELHRGAVIAAPGSIVSTRTFRAVAYMLNESEGGRQTPIPESWTPRFLLRSAEVDGTVALPAGLETLRPGEHSEMNIKLGAQVALETKQRFGIKETGRTVGAGVVTEVVH